MRVPGGLRFALYVALFAVVYASPFAHAAELLDFRDAHPLQVYERAAVMSLLRHGELPLWNPYYCGGFDALGSPQTRFAAPTLLLGLLFGPERAAPLVALLVSVLGAEGAYRLFREHGARPWAAFAASPLLPLSSHFALA